MSLSAGLAAAMPLRGLQFETGHNLLASPCGCHPSWRAANSKQVSGVCDIEPIHIVSKTVGVKGSQGQLTLRARG